MTKTATIITKPLIKIVKITVRIILNQIKRLVSILPSRLPTFPIHVKDEDKNTKKYLLITVVILLAVGLITGISSYLISPRSDEVSESPVSDEKPHSSIVDEETDNWEPSKVI